MSKKTSFGLAFILLMLLTAAALFVAARVTFFRDSSPLPVPEYAPQAEEPNAEKIPGDSEEKMDSPEGGSSVSLTYSGEAVIDLSEGRVYMFFANPSRSNQDLVVQLCVQDTELVRSGLLTPGKQLSQLELPENSAALLSPGTYAGQYVISYYAPESGEKAIVNTKVDISVTVKE